MPADVNAYHAAGGYLEQLAAAADKIIKEHPSK
jgi:hypothetical protein